MIELSPISVERCGNGPLACPRCKQETGGSRIAHRAPSRRPRTSRQLRAAYLELLKLCLCDLAGPGTTSVWTHTDGTLLSRELGARRARHPGGRRRLAAARHDDGRPAAARRPAGVRRGDRARRRRGRPDRGRDLARRRFDPHARDARRARRRRPHGVGRRLLPGLPGRRRGARADRLPGGPGRGRARQLRPPRLRAGRALRRGLLRGHAARPGRRALVAGAARRRHLRGDVDDAAGALPRAGGRRLRDRRRLRRARGVPARGRRVPRPARDRGPDRGGRLDLRALAAQLRRGDRARPPPRAPRAAPARAVERAPRDTPRRVDPRAQPDAREAPARAGDRAPARAARRRRARRSPRCAATRSAARGRSRAACEACCQ